LKKEIKEKLLDEYEVSLPKNIMDSLPEELNFDNIGNIDLNEAERIANDDLFFLSESDLIEELKDFDLLPVEDDTPEIENVEIKEKSPKIENVGIKEKSPKIENVETKEETPKIENVEIIEETPEIENVEIKEKSPEIENVEIKEETPKIENVEIKEESPKIENVEIKEETPEIENVEIKKETSKIENVEVTDETPKVNIVEIEEEIPEDKSVDVNDLNYSIEDILNGNVKKEIKELDKKKSEKIEEIENWDILAKSVPIVLESLPESYKNIGLNNHDLFFIDDVAVEKDSNEKNYIFEINELENLSSSVLDNVDGNPKILNEFDHEDDIENIMDIVQGVNPEFEDLLFEFDEADYRYRDDDIDFIHSTVIEADYSKFISIIDEYYSEEKVAFVSSVTEILSLTSMEIDLYEDILFSSLYRDVDLDLYLDSNKILKIFNRSFDGKKDCIYVLERDDSISEKIKVSIEEDISTNTAIIFEEDIELIRSQLKRNILNEKVEKIEITDEVYDITNQIVILEDDEDVQRFINTISKDKQEDLIKLMSYLDGLFEKLPENVIKNFADSEYFELYTEVLNKLGI